MKKIKSPIVEIDLHGLLKKAAKDKIDITLKKVGPSVYRIRLIHGYNNGTSIRSMIRREYSHGENEKVLRVEMGENEGITYLVLREYY